MYVHQFLIVYSFVLVFFCIFLVIGLLCVVSLKLVGVTHLCQMIKRNYKGGKTQTIFPLLYCLIKCVVGELG